MRTAPLHRGEKRLNRRKKWGRIADTYLDPYLKYK
jgi:hypothetical protein